VVLFARGEGLGPITWPAGISTDGPVGKPPPDLASSARWARLSGWEDPEGPGALDLATRAALRSRNDEIARRGRAAYDAGAAMSGGEETPKKDREQVPALLGNLAAVAAEEPLAPEDLLLLARGLRFLNRKPEALAVLSGLDAHPGWRGSARLLYERALTLESAEDFAAAQATWEALVRGGSAAYGRMADRAAERLAGWQAEAEARAADEARGDLPLVLLRTNRGNVVLLLHRADVEASVDHFLALVRRREGDRGFYDGTLFHRVVGDFMAQGGDPASRDASCEDAGRGDGPSTLPVEVNRRHGFWRGAVGFARGKAAWNGCQFFLLVSPRPELAEKGFTCFGHVVAGLSAVDRLEACDVLLEARVLRPEAGPAPQPEGER
jgi:cyclophilin family peptidyl-prolyl cis-trans isomerase